MRGLCSTYFPAAAALPGSSLAFEDRGEHELKRIDGPSRLYSALA